MKIALIVIAVIAVGVLVVKGISHRYWTPEKKAERLTQVMTKKLDLNEEQKAKLDVLKEQVLAAKSEMKSSREKDLSTVQELLSQPKFDQQRAQGVINGHIQNLSTRSPEIVAALGEFWDSLNPDQQAKVKTKLEKLQSCKKRW